MRTSEIEQALATQPSPADPPLATLLIGDSVRSADMYAATGHLSSDSFIIIVTPHGTTAIVDGEEVEAARRRESAAEVLAKDDYGWLGHAVRAGSAEVADLEVAREALISRGIGSITVPSWLPAGFVAHLRNAGIRVDVSARLVPSRSLLKSEADIASIEEVLRVAEHALAETLSVLRLATVERDGTLTTYGEPVTVGLLQDVAVSAWLARRCEGEVPIVAGSSAGATTLPCTDDVLRAREPIVCDLFPRHLASRFHADITRTVCVGPAPQEVRRAHRLVLEALDLAKSLIAPGVTGSSVYRAVQDHFVRHGCGAPLSSESPPRDGAPCFAPYLGHGLGLELHEWAVGIQPYNHIELQPGHVLTAEPELRLAGGGVVRVEDVVVVTDTGCRTLTEFPYGLSLEGPPP